MKNKVELFLEDMTYNTKFEFLEEAKSDELKKIAEKRGIKLPAHDLAVFKGRYAYIDRMNKNNCTLPKEEVEKALDTLIGKAIDFDHLRKRVVGYWIDSVIEENEILAYGIFFKGNFSEDYTTIKELMEKDVLAISFEAYGNKEHTSGLAYNLTDIEFAGGALLIKEKPAFPGSEVLEMANKDRVLEFAKVMTKPIEFIHTEDRKIDKQLDLSQYYGEFGDLTETARFYVWDLQGIMKLLGEVDCLTCKEKGMIDLLAIDFETNNARIKCINCGAIMKVELTPKAKLVKKGRKVKKISTLEHKDGGIKMKETEVKKDIKKADEEVKKDTEVKEEVKEETKEVKEETTEKKDEEVKEEKPAEEAPAKEEAPAEETEEAKKITKLEVELKNAKAELLKIEKAKKDAKIKERKEELGEFAKDMTDEDLLNDLKFENAKLKKYIADKEAGKQVKVPVDLTKGSVKKGEDEITTKRNTIRDLAFKD